MKAKKPTQAELKRRWKKNKDEAALRQIVADIVVREIKKIDSDLASQIVSYRKMIDDSAINPELRRLARRRLQSLLVPDIALGRPKGRRDVNSHKIDKLIWFFMQDPKRAGWRKKFATNIERYAAIAETLQSRKLGKHAWQSVKMRHFRLVREHNYRPES